MKKIDKLLKSVFLLIILWAIVGFLFAVVLEKMKII